MGILFIGMLLWFILAINAIPTKADIPISSFKSVWDIRQYVKNSGVPELRRTENDFDCEDFAFALCQQAVTDNVPMGMLLVLRYDDGRLTDFHTKNFTWIGNHIYEVEPRNGNVWMLRGYEAKWDK